MDWDDVEEILFDGTKETIKNLKCVNEGCSGNIEYEFNSKFNSFVVKCQKCGHYSKSNGVFYIPSCVKIFGDKFMISRQ